MERSKKPTIIESLVPRIFHLCEYDNNIICHKKGCSTLNPLYSIKTEQQYRTPCCSYCPQGNISPQKYFKEFIYNIHTKLLN